MGASAILVSVITLGGICLAFGTLIAFANRKLKVWEDPRIEEVTERLPGSNCGACGFAGCRSFAEGLVEGKSQPAGCTQLGADAIENLAGYLGVDAGEAVKRVARLLCAGGADVALQQAEYRGLATCSAAAAVAGGGKGCAWGCIGLGDCDVVCDYDAIHMNANGIPVVEPEKCTACGDCVEACPKDLFVLMPMDQRLIVQCKNALEGDGAEALCRVACTACGRCALDAAPGVVEMKDGLAVVDYSKNELTGPEAIARCPTGAIVWVEGAQFSSTSETRVPAGSGSV
ncbi:MAG: RnfABCDGE type electron transport complex subunit B [Planctomycetota bacterium]|jgi:RnfABCDGE-type electron transport complex B subunit